MPAGASARTCSRTAPAPGWAASLLTGSPARYGLWAAGVIGAIAGSAVPLTAALTHPWQYAVLAGAGVRLLVLRHNVVPALLLAAAVGATGAALGLLTTT